MLSIKTGKMISINDILIFITLLVSFTNIAWTQTYNDAVCNGANIESLRVTSNIVDTIDFNPNDIDNTLSFGTRTFTTSPDIGNVQFIASAIHPETGKIYTIFKVNNIVTNKNYYIGELPTSGDGVIEQQLISTTNTEFYSGMTFDCDGNLYAINHESREIFTINETTGAVTPFQNGGTAACEEGNDCSETFSYNWDDNQLYRISSHTSTINGLFIESLDMNTEVKYNISDPNNYCTNVIECIEYIGNDLFLICCDVSNSMRLLDISDIQGTGPIIKPIDTSSIDYPTATHGVGVVATKPNGDLCTAECPTDAPTNNPTTQPTTIPTANPITANPTHIPTIQPTNIPTYIPTEMPTNIPTSIPTEMPTIIPTSIPTINPTTGNPSKTPTLIPTINPTTANPTRIPSTNPTGIPTMNPITIRPSEDSSAPTSVPSITPTIEDNCPLCPYNISLIEISPLSLSSNCPTVSPTPYPTSSKIWKRRSEDSESSVQITKTVITVPRYYSNSDSNKNVNINTNNNHNGVDSRDSGSDDGVDSRDSGSDSGSGSGSGSSRRRLRVPGTRRYYNSDSSEDIINRCFPDGNPLIFVDDLCDNNNNNNGYYVSTSDSDSNEINLLTDNFLSQTICVIYNINDFTPNDSDCGNINNIFLGLCENENTDFDSSLLGIGDINHIISNHTFEYGNNILTAIGARNNQGELGVLIELNDMNIEMFTICFENVSVTADFNQTKDSLHIAKGYINFKNNIGDDILCPSQGLPCLNFFFGCEEDLIGPEQNELNGRSVIGLLSETRNCDCSNGMTALTLRYDGPVMADHIIGYFGGKKKIRIICTFSNVMPGSFITCTSETIRRGIFGRNTKFSISYNEYDSSNTNIKGDCFGKIRTTCSNQIIGDRLRGCKDLIVISHIDGNGALCDAQILALETNNNANALINNQQYINDPLNVLNELDPYIKWTLICIFIAFIILIFASIYVCFSYKCKKNNQDEENDDINIDYNDEDIDAIASAIALSKQNKQSNGDMENDLENNENSNEEMHQLNEIWDINDIEDDYCHNNTQHTFEVTS